MDRPQAQHWPWPEDTREDKAKRIARMYRNALYNVARGLPDDDGLPYDPAGELHRIEEFLKQHGVYWPIPAHDPYDGTEWVNARDAAHYADVQPGTIRKWAARKHIRVDHDHDGTPLYQIADLRAYDAKRRRTAKGTTP